MISNAFQRARSVDLPGSRPAGLPVRLLLVVAFFTAAFAIDLLSDRRYSQILGGAAIFGLVLTLFPAIRPGLIATSAYALIWTGFNLVRAFADDAGLAIADPRTVSGIERWLFGGSLPATILQDRAFDPGRVQVHDVAFAIVHGSFFIVPSVIAVIAWWCRRPLFHQYLLATAICFAVSLVAFTLLPTAPPWMSDPADVTRITHQILHGPASGPGATGSVNRDEAFWFEPNDLAALPSVHVAVAVLVSLVLGRFARWGRVPGALYALAMSVSVVYLGEHFALDLISGWLVALASAPRPAPERHPEGLIPVLPRSWPTHAGCQLAARASGDGNPKPIPVGGAALCGCPGQATRPIRFPQGRLRVAATKAGLAPPNRRDRERQDRGPSSSS